MDSVVWVFEQGGWVSYALALVSIFLWTAVSLRALALRASYHADTNPESKSGSVLTRFERDARRLGHYPERLLAIAERAKRDLETMRGVIGTLVAVAPLLGLLGTVIGMVEMFGSLRGALAAGGESTVAGGISTALVTTQLGLVIATPGLFASYMLSRRQLRRERDISEILKSIRGIES